jgi:hypothetical protein
MGVLQLDANETTVPFDFHDPPGAAIDRRFVQLELDSAMSLTELMAAQAHHHQVFWTRPGSRSTRSFCSRYPPSW